MLPIRTILHPTDFSTLSEDAFQMAASLARDHGARLILLHVVVRPIPSSELLYIAPEPEDYQARLWDEFRQLEKSDPRIRQVNIQTKFVEGEPAEEILRVAKEAECDLIVMGTHGRSGLRRLVMGSVAEQVIRGASCSVLAVKGAVPSELSAEKAAVETPEFSEAVSTTT